MKWKELVAHVDEQAKFLLTAVGLWGDRDKLVSEYSGGMKRRLAVTIAFMGNPAVVLLDLPSLGLDPHSRQELWRLIGKLKRRTGCALVITTHSVDECEALGDKIGILVRGRLECLDTHQGLLRRFGYGHVLRATVTDVDRTLDLVKAHVGNTATVELRENFSSSVEIGIVHQWGAGPEYPGTDDDLERPADMSGLASAELASTGSATRKDSLWEEQGKLLLPVELVRELEHKKTEVVQEWSLRSANLQDVFISVTRRAPDRAITARDTRDAETALA